MSDISKTMPLWGPYSKKYMGISRLSDTDMSSGARFDFSVHPTVWNSSVPVPNVTFPSNYHLWSCKGDYSFYSYRYELMWKDMIYCDVSFSRINDSAYLMRCEFVNNTSLKQNCILNGYSAMEYPKRFSQSLIHPKRRLLSALMIMRIIHTPIPARGIGKIRTVWQRASFQIIIL